MLFPNIACPPSDKLYLGHVEGKRRIHFVPLHALDATMATNDIEGFNEWVEHYFLQQQRNPLDAMILDG